jgi:hypothetical protein
MWKKQEDAAGPQPEFDSRPAPESIEENDEALIKAYRDHVAEKGKSAITPQKTSTERQDQPPRPATLETYTEAVNEFTKNAAAFIEQIPLFAKARDSYDHAMRVSAEMRKVLDAGDESLRNLMAQLQQTVDLQAERAAPDKKKPEPLKVEAIRESEDRKTSRQGF